MLVAQAADFAGVVAFVVVQQRFVPHLDNRMAYRFARLGVGSLVVAHAVAGGKSTILVGLMAYSVWGLDSWADYVDYKARWAWVELWDWVRDSSVRPVQPALVVVCVAGRRRSPRYRGWGGE